MGRAPGADAILDARRSARRHLLSLQKADGFWEGEVVWCPIILAQWILVRRVVGRPLTQEERDLAIRHFEVTRTRQGAWGLHRESPPYVFVTVLSYVALRVLGLSAEDPRVEPARRWLAGVPGGAAAIPAWGKLWLALVGLLPFEAVPPAPPEAVLLPEGFPGNPRSLYCHTRSIYLAMSFLYGSRFQAPLGMLGGELQRELFGEEWSRRKLLSVPVAPSDLYRAPGPALRALAAGLRLFERVVPARLRSLALDRCFEEILFEQRVTNYEAVSPVNGLLNTLAIFSRGTDHPDLEPSLRGLERWKWSDRESGLRLAGARSQAWDTAFALRALLEGGEAAEIEPIARAHAWLARAQLTEALPDGSRHGRQAVAGGWCFSDGSHRWPVSDCTAEALSAILEAEGRPEIARAVEPLGRERVELAVGFLLDRQNDDGGFGTYERRRAGVWLESWNPSEMFDGCMTDRSHVECTASCLAALARVRRRHPAIRSAEVTRAIDSGIVYLRRAQWPDGSFPAAWGIQFTYSAFFAVEGLIAAEVPPEDPALVALARRLLSWQKSDGGWGEDYRGCLGGRYVEHRDSQVEMTSWALLALIPVLGAEPEAVVSGARWLAQRHGADGSFPRGAVNGVFFKTAMLDYTLYRSYFPAWALARFRRRQESDTAG